MRDEGAVTEVLLLQVREYMEYLGVYAGDGLDELLLLELIIILVVILEIFDDEVDHHDVIRMTPHSLD